MRARLRSWWQKTSKTLDVVIISSLVILLVLLVLIILGYANNWPWAGLHGKTLYDWLQLLIIPTILAIGGYIFNLTLSRNEQKSTQLRDQTEREIAADNQWEAALQAYLDSMSELLLHENLRNSGAEDEVRKIARVRTLTALPRLDPKRKGSVLLFLAESGLIDIGGPIIDLYRADLSRVQLYKPWLNEVNLSETNLSEADLYEADLFAANLSKADLHEAHLVGANLAYADLSGAIVTTEQLDKAKSLDGATMPDGTKHV